MFFVDVTIVILLWEALASSRSVRAVAQQSVSDQFESTIRQQSFTCICPKHSAAGDQARIGKTEIEQKGDLTVMSLAV